MKARPRGPAVAPTLVLTALILCMALAGSALPLAVAPPAASPAPTPACPEARYRDAAALLAALPGADYACAEELAAALRPLADSGTVDALLAMARQGAHSRERRNAVRALGRLAESPRGSRARELMLRARAAAVQATMAELLVKEEENFLLQDAVWLVDTAYFPDFSAAPALAQVAGRRELAPALRFRAAAARARLIYARPGALSAADEGFVLGALRSDDPGVRAAAAMAAARLRADQLTAATQARLVEALAQAWGAEPPLALAPDGPTEVGLLGFQESSPTSLTAWAAMARARDRLEGGEHLLRLRADYEALALPNSLVSGELTLRAGLPAEALPGIIAELARARTAFHAIVGPAAAAPLPGEGTGGLTVLIFARQGIYRDYMRAFTPFTVDVDGTYDEATATIYTHERTLEQSENTLLATLRHELAHHEAGLRLFAGGWLTPGYHAEPKGWADEGLAELLAGLTEAGPRPRRQQLARLCDAAQPHNPGALLAARAGYDRFGRFDYDRAWALSYYLLSERPASLRRLYGAYRDGSYRLRDWERIAGLTLAQTQAELEAAQARWCEELRSPVERG